MIFDVTEANRLLNLSGITRDDANEQDKEKLFFELSNAPQEGNYNPPNDDIDAEICNFPHEVIFDMKDIDFCLIAEDDCISLFVSLKCDDSWDQHMAVNGIDDENSEWVNSMEQSWEYNGDKNIDTLCAELKAMGGTYSKQLEYYFVED